MSRYTQTGFSCFNTQPPEGGWLQKLKSEFGLVVSTHSRPKAAGKLAAITFLTLLVSTHSRPKAAGPTVTSRYHRKLVSTHSRPKAAGFCFNECRHVIKRFNTQPPEGGWDTMQAVSLCVSMFQHTAARRRLGSTYQQIAADQSGFNTQPPEGGW